MLVIEMQFLSGRYHATPWGRNVNEGEAEWPISPYRFVRSLIDAWKRRKPDWPAERVEPLLKALSIPPFFNLPEASAAHTRSFLSSNERDPTKKQLVFDAFVALEHYDKVLMGFDCVLGSESIKDLESILEELNYLGRSESWVRASVVKELEDITWNCLPISDDSTFQGNKTVRVACVLPAEMYDKLPYKPDTLTWLNALCFTTKDLLSEGWSNPPALFWVEYGHKHDPFRSLPSRPLPPLRSRFRFAKYALKSSVLPRVQETVFFAERIRSHLMGIHKRIRNGDPTLVSSLFSGKRPNGEPIKGHNHAFFLPLDEDGDGRLDHMLVFASDPFDSSELAAIDHLHSVWQPDRRPDVNLVIVSLSAEIPKQKSRQWVSATPFVTSRHYRKGRGLFEEWLTSEISRECEFHGLPEPKEVRWIPHTLTTHHPIRWMEFVRSRKNSQALRGYGCVIGFDESIPGPFALGSGCHFGLGLFSAYDGT